MTTEQCSTLTFTQTSGWVDYIKLAALAWIRGWFFLNPSPGGAVLGLTYRHGCSAGCCSAQLRISAVDH